MKKNAKQIVHELYNDISISKDPKYSDILEVLQKVYLKLEKQKYELDPGPLINRLVNYLYFTRNEIVELLLLAQERIERNLSEIGRTAVFSIGSQTFTFDINDIYFVEASKLPHRLSLCTKDGQ
ncbi:hypothetical protein EfmGK961_04710 [Enterococcus faecium]|nr:hypothetical protein EfmGK961_04710 [Enterococcus faecium]